MLLETIIGAGVLYHIGKNFVHIDFKLKPYAIAQTVEKAKQTVADAGETVKKSLVSESEWQERKAKQNAQAVYDKTVAGVFENATEEEKGAILELFKKYAPVDQ